MAGFRTRRQFVTAAGSKLADNRVSFELEGVDGKDYIAIDTSDGSEVMTLSAGGSSGQLLRVEASKMRYAASGTMAILAEDPTATNPVFVPNATDEDTGIGWAAADALSLVAGSVEAIRCVEDSSAATIQFGQDTYDPMIQQASGTAAGSVGYSFKGDTDTGMSSGAGSNQFALVSNGANKLTIESDGAAAGSAYSISNHEFEANNGSRFIAFDIQNTTSAINFGGSGLGSANKKEMTIGSHAVSNICFSKYGIAYQKFQLGQINSWNDDQTNGNRTVYLDDSNTDLNVQFQMGNVGMIELVDNVDKIKLWGLPGFGSVVTFTLRIKQHASAAKTLSYSTIEYSTGAPGSSALSGTTTFTWAGGAPHVMSTGTGDIDIVQFTAFCDTANNIDVYASVIGQNFS